MSRSSNAPLCQTIMDALSEEIREMEPTLDVWQSAARSYEQLLTELQTVTRLPAAVVVVSTGDFDEGAQTCDLIAGVILITSFQTHQGDKVAEVYGVLDAAVDHFREPRELPYGAGAAKLARFYPVELSADFASMAIELKIMVPMEV